MTNDDDDDAGVAELVLDRRRRAGRRASAPQKVDAEAEGRERRAEPTYAWTRPVVAVRRTDADARLSAIMIRAAFTPTGRGRGRCSGSRWCARRSLRDDDDDDDSTPRSARFILFTVRDRRRRKRYATYRLG